MLETRPVPLALLPRTNTQCSGASHFCFFFVSEKMAGEIEYYRLKQPQNYFAPLRTGIVKDEGFQN